MRAICLSLCLAASGSVAACGPAKPAQSPSSEGDSPSPSDDKTLKADIEGTSTPPLRAAAPPSTTPSSGVPYDKEQVELELKRGARQVKANCGAATDEEGKANGPWGSGTVTVTLGHNGHAHGATISAPFDGKPVGRCAVQAFAILPFPPFAGADVTVDWPVEIVQPGAH